MYIWKFCGELESSVFCLNENQINRKMDTPEMWVRIIYSSQCYRLSFLSFIPRRRKFCSRTKVKLKLLFVLFCSAAVYEAMDKRTRKFLVDLPTMLRRYFSAGKSLEYLESMDKHLETFYSDILDELNERKEECELDIEGT